MHRWIEMCAVWGGAVDLGRAWLKVERHTAPPGPASSATVERSVHVVTGHS